MNGDGDPKPTGRLLPFEIRENIVYISSWKNKMSAAALKLPLAVEGNEVVERQLGVLQSDVKHLDERIQRHEEATLRQFALLEGNLNTRLNTLDKNMDIAMELMAEIRGGTKTLRWIGTAAVAITTFVATAAWWMFDKWDLFKFPIVK